MACTPSSKMGCNNFGKKSVAEGQKILILDESCVMQYQSSLGERRDNVIFFITPLTNQKIKIPRDIIILHKWIRNQDNMLYYSLDVACDKCPPPSPYHPKIKIKKKWKKHLEMSSFYISTKNYDQVMYSSWDMVCNRRPDRKSDIEVSVPPKSNHSNLLWMGQYGIRT